MNNKNYILTENQLSIILSEVRSDKISSSVKTLNSFTKSVISKVNKTYKINMRLLLTWGSSVGGLMMPLNEYVKSGQFNMTEEQICLVILGVVSTYFINNKSTIENILNKIKEEGLEEYYKKALRKSNLLKKTFFGFIDSLRLTIDNTIDLISYTFLIPIVDDILSYVDYSKSFQEVSELVTERLVSSGVVLLSGTVLVQVIDKIIHRFYREEPTQ